MTTGVGRGRGCIHLLAFQPGPGDLRYRCVHCFRRLKIANGVEMTPEQERAWFNCHGQRWGWELDNEIQERSNRQNRGAA